MSNAASLLRSCILCREFDGDADISNFRRLCGSEHRARTIYENDLFVVVPSLGPVVFGHVMVCPKQHYLSFRETLRAQVCRRAFSDALQCAREVVTTVTGEPTVLFEHGPSSPGAPIGCGTDHAHLHVLPWRQDEVAGVTATRFEWRSLQRGWDSLVDGNLPLTSNYLLFVSQANEFRLATDVNAEVRSFFRHYFGARSGNPVPEWRAMPRPALVNRFLDEALDLGVPSAV